MSSNSGIEETVFTVYPPRYENVVPSAPEIYHQRPPTTTITTKLSRYKSKIFWFKTKDFFNFNKFFLKVPVSTQPRVMKVNQVQIYDRNPQTLRCPHCGTMIITRTETVATRHTHLVAALCCLFGWTKILYLIPLIYKEFLFQWGVLIENFYSDFYFSICGPCIYCIDECKGVKHFCPNFEKVLGIYDDHK